eukprot:5646137-Prymnesium_polylepis.1
MSRTECANQGADAIGANTRSRDPQCFAPKAGPFPLRTFGGVRSWVHLPTAGGWSGSRPPTAESHGHESG